MRRASSLALLCLAVLLAGCGDDAEGPDVTNPQTVFRLAMEAVHDGDWAVLQDALTKDARHALEADMRKLHKNLVARDKNLMRVVAQQLGDGGDAAVAEAIGRSQKTPDMPRMLRFFVALSPREREPAQRGLRVDPKTQSMQIAYALANGEERLVTLVQGSGRWYVANLQL